MDPGKVREPSKADEKQRSEKLLESPWGYERVSEAIERARRAKESHR